MCEEASKACEVHTVGGFVCTFPVCPRAARVDPVRVGRGAKV